MIKTFNFIFFCFILFYQNVSYSKKLDSANFYKYFSALVSYDNNQNLKSLKFFNSSKDLKESHQSYIKNYLFSLILNGKIDRAIAEIKSLKNKNFSDFFEAHLLLVLDGIKKKDYKIVNFHIDKLKKHKERGTFEYIISTGLEEYVYLFNNNEITKDLSNDFGNFSLINKSFQNCYLKNSKTESYFLNLINSEEIGYSRYIFFYINFLLSQQKFSEVENFYENIDYLDSTLLVAQSKKWIEDKNYNNFKEIFSCQNPNDVIAEFIFVIANLYSSEGFLKESEFYVNLSSYLNPKFIFNNSLSAENYYKSKNYEQSKRILNKFTKKNKIYHWYKIKKIAEIIKKEKNFEASLKYIQNEFNKIENPSLKIIYDMANILKGFEKYELSIKYYSKILLELDDKSLIYADILYRRGGSYERLGEEKKSDTDMLLSLEINPDEPYVLNYLAYSWLERNYKIDTAIEMLKQAYEQKQNDPYIIDSIGWAYYLIGDYEDAESLLKKAVQLMPNDPIVNDHYGDILWKLGRKIQAKYFWENVLTFEDTENKMKEEIFYKLLKGPKKI